MEGEMEYVFGFFVGLVCMAIGRFIIVRFDRYMELMTLFDTFPRGGRFTQAMHRYWGGGLCLVGGALFVVLSVVVPVALLLDG